MIQDKLPKTLKCLISHDIQTGLWISHCLDFDIVASGASEDAAWTSMKLALKAQVESCFADGFEAGLSRQAPFEIWREFADHVFSGNVRSEPIVFELQEADHRLTSGFWMKGVEVEPLPTCISAGA